MTKKLGTFLQNLVTRACIPYLDPSLKINENCTKQQTANHDQIFQPKTSVSVIDSIPWSIYWATYF